MKKNIYIWIILSCFLLITTGIFYFIMIHDARVIPDDPIIHTWSIIEDTVTVPLQKTAVQKQVAKEKIAKIRKKLALKWLIVEWEIHLENHEYTIALSKFLQIQKEIPDDHQITKNIGDIFFALKRFSSAYKYYKNIVHDSNADIHQTVIALLASRPINEENISYFTKEISGLPLVEEEAYYYLNALACTKDISQCKQRYQDFFAKKTPEEIMPDTLISVQQALENYKNFQIDDLSYKNALLVGSFFEQGLYPISIILGEGILQERSWYAPILKIIAKSHFELWNYTQARKYLWEYNSAHPDETDISFALWVVYEKLKEYVISTIHFKKALDLWYEPSVDIRRKLIYNYHEIWDREKVLAHFKELIQLNKEDLESKDYSLAIYHHIIDERYDVAKEFIQEAIKKFPTDELFDGYMAWILLEQSEDDLTLASEYIESGLEKNKKNAMLNLLAGKLKAKQWDKLWAIIYFKQTMALDEYGELSEQAKQELEALEKIEQ